MRALPTSWNKAVIPLLLAAGLATAFLLLRGDGERGRSGVAEHYRAQSIALVYADVGDFRAFLERNAGKKVRIDSAIALDHVIPVNVLVHDVCAIEEPDEDAIAAPDGAFTIGLPRFAEGFDEQALNAAVLNACANEPLIPAALRAQVSCEDTLRLELLDPQSLRWRYGGTGTQSLPLHGIFEVTTRQLPGPRIEYTLRQVKQ